MLAISLEQSVPPTDLVNNGKAPHSLKLFEGGKQGFLSPLVVHRAHTLKQIFKRLVDVSAAGFAIVDLPKTGQHIVWMGRIRYSLPSIPG